MNNKTKRIGMSIFGVAVAGFSVGIFRMAALGVDPFQSFVSGLFAVFPISFGTLYLIVNCILLLFSFFTCRRYIGIATFINLFLLGYVVEFSYALMQSLFPEIGIVGRIVSLIVAIIILCFASSFYIVADLGVSTYDAISLIIANEWKVMKFKYCRIICDVVCVIIGALLLLSVGTSFGEIMTVVGVGTIITAFFMGPLIDFCIRKVARPFLEHKTKV